MAVSEIGLIILAIHLARDPSAVNIEKFNSLPQQQQAIVQSLIWEKAAIPPEIEEWSAPHDATSLFKDAPVRKEERRAIAPTVQKYKIQIFNH